MSATPPPPLGETARFKLEVVRASLDRALPCTLDLYRVLDRSIVRDVIRYLDDALILARELYVGRNLDLGRVIIALDLARDVALALDRDLGGALVLLLDRDHTRDRDLSQALDPSPGGDIFVDLHRDNRQELVERVKAALARMVELETYLSAEGKVAGSSRERSNVAVSRAAARVAAWSVRVLPSADRPRYDEEFRRELQDLADTDAGRRAQFRHAVRLLNRAVSLRRAVMKARSRRAVS